MPSILVAPFSGDRGELPAQATWENGVWTLEWNRKLTTGSPTDVQFDDMGKKCAFGAPCLTMPRRGTRCILVRAS